MKNIGGYRVHADKILKNGVPIYAPYILERAEGREKVEKAYICRVDNNGNRLGGTEKELGADTICLAVGLEPYSNLLRILGCYHTYNRDIGGFVPLHNGNLETTKEGIFVCGDVSGIEEATTAMEEGRLAALSSCFKLNLLRKDDFIFKRDEIRNRLDELRAGEIGEVIRIAKENMLNQYCSFTNTNKEPKHSGAASVDFSNSSDGSDNVKNIAGSSSYNVNGDRSDEVKKFVLIECFEAIACNPCEKACPRGAIKIGEDITGIPKIDYSLCNGCGLCIPSCPGLAIRVIDKERNLVDLPYEFLPVPAVGESVDILDSKGNVLGKGRVAKVRNNKNFNRTIIVTVKVDKKYLFITKSIRCRGTGKNE